MNDRKEFCFLIDKIFVLFEIKPGMKNYLPFYNYLKYKPKIYKLYFIALCHVNLDINNLQLFFVIFDDYLKNRNIITFKELYEKDFSWYKYYYQSANPKGKLINGEQRLGLNRNIVNDIMQIKKILHTDLDHAIIMYYNLQYVYFHNNDLKKLILNEITN